MVLKDREWLKMNELLFKEVEWVKRFIEGQSNQFTPETIEIHNLLKRLDGIDKEDFQIFRKTKELLLIDALKDRVRGKSIDEIKKMYPFWDVSGIVRPNLGLRGYLLDHGTDPETIDAARKLLLVSTTINNLVASLQDVYGYVALPGKIVDYVTFREIAEAGTHIFYGVSVSKETQSYIEMLDLALFTQVTDYVQYGMSSLFPNSPALAFVSMHGYRFLEIGVTGAKYYLPRTRIHYNHDESSYLCDICEAPNATLIHEGERSLYLCEEHRKKR